MKERLDMLLVNRNLAESREKAKAIIMAGNVRVKGRREDKPGAMFPDDADIELKGMLPRYVSRGGFKLEKAIDVFVIDLRDKVCMDVGSSTGGFTDCMLQNGSRKVYAIDVGTNQLAWKLRSDGRVFSMENTNIRYILPEDIGEMVDFVTVDVAFISLTKVLPAVYPLMKDQAGMVCLIKPQFEAGRGDVGHKGVVRDPKLHADVIRSICEHATEYGYGVVSLNYSPIKGPKGNIEFLSYMEKGTKNQVLDMGMINNVVLKAHEELG